MAGRLGRIRHKLPRPRLGLRWAMVAVLVAGGGFGWIVARARSQAESVAAIERAGGGVKYDWESHISRGQVIPARPIPGWLMRNLGPDYFSTVVIASISGGRESPRIDATLANKVGHLRRLEILRFDSTSSIDDAGLAQLSGLTELRWLGLPDSGWTGAGLVHLARMRELELLELRKVPLRDEHLAAFSGLTKLYTLDLMVDRLSDLGISHLAPLTNLKQLDIDDGNPRVVKHAKPATPSNPEGLAEVGAEPTVITGRGLRALSGMSKLRSLRISSSRIEDLGPIGGLTALGELSLPNASITDEGLAPIAGLTDLDRLVLNKNPDLGDAGMAHLSGLPKLRDLWLQGTAVGDSGLPAIGRIASLAMLDLSRTRVTDAGLASLAGLKNLEQLTLSETRVTGAGLASLAGLTALKSVTLVDSGATDEGLAGIARLPGLDHLTLWRTKVTVDGLARLASMPKLRHLSVDGTGLSDDDLPRLKLPPACKVFGVWRTKLTPAGVATLRARYPGVEIRNK